MSDNGNGHRLKPAPRNRAKCESATSAVDLFIPLSLFGGIGLEFKYKKLGERVYGDGGRMTKLIAFSSDWWEYGRGRCLYLVLTIWHSEFWITLSRMSW